MGDPSETLDGKWSEQDAYKFIFADTLGNHDVDR